nr:hypothetical protein [Tanacetum cinerariifolium]
MDDESNQGRMIAKMDQDDAVVLKDDKEEDKQVADAVKDVEEVKVDRQKHKFVYSLASTSVGYRHWSESTSKVAEWHS